MKVVDKFIIASHNGQIVGIQLDGANPKTGDTIKRTNDDQTWIVRGRELFCIPHAEEYDQRRNLGSILVNDNPSIQIGDELIIVQK